MEKIKPIGILWEGNKIVNYRSVLKVILNPILRCFALQIVSLFDNTKFIKYELRKCRWQPNIFKNYYSSLFTCNEYDKVE